MTEAIQFSPNLTPDSTLCDKILAAPVPFTRSFFTVSLVDVAPFDDRDSSSPNDRGEIQRELESAGCI